MAKQNKTKRPSAGPKFNIYWLWGAVALVMLTWNLWGNNVAPAEITWSDFKTQMLDSNYVAKVDVINKATAEVYIKKDDVARFSKQEKYKHIPQEGPQFYFNIGDVQIFNENLKEAQTDVQADSRLSVTYQERTSPWKDLLYTILPIVIIIGVWILIMRSMSRGGGSGGGGGVFSVGKAKAQLFDKDNNVNINFKDVAGLAEAKVEIMEIVDFLKNPKKYKDLGGKIPKGALLVGPPGTGKTLLAKAVAGEANVPFFSISGSDFVEMFVGVGASRVRDLFRQAKEKAPCIVFIDEIDAIGRARGKNSGWSSNDERENTLNQLLTEMDGFGTNAGVIILAATNRADILDKALLRAGRFDRQIHVELPDLKERAEIFDVHLKGLKLDPNLDRDFLSKQTPGFSGADIANVCNEAALIAARHNKAFVDRQDFLDAIDRIIGGLERKNKIISIEEKRTIAYHEAGHATVSWLLEHANPLVKVTIIPRGKALGAAWYLPEERQITTRQQLMDEMASILGGRASEQLNFGKISTGALNDLERVTKMSYAMIAYYGMSDTIGNLSYYDSTGQADMAFNRPYSEVTAQNIDIEVRKTIDEAYVLAYETLANNREGLTKLAELLLDREVVFSEDLERIFGKRKGDKSEEPVKKEDNAVVEAAAEPAVAVSEASENSESQKTEDAKAADQELKF